MAQGLPVLPALQLGCWVGSEIRILICFCSRWSLQLVDTLCSVLYSVLMTVTLSEFLWQFLSCCPYSNHNMRMAHHYLISPLRECHNNQFILAGQSLPPLSTFIILSLFLLHSLSSLCFLHLLSLSLELCSEQYIVNQVSVTFLKSENCELF